MSRSTLLRNGLLGVLAALCAAPAAALEFNIGDAVLGVDTTLTLGVTRRMEDRDAGLIAYSNGGTERTSNEDDGDLNYGKGDWISQAFKATSDVNLKYGDYGYFGRVTYTYDREAKKAAFLGPVAHERLDSKLEWLDSVLYANPHFNDHPMSIRLGRQVINWGESTFIGNSINVINPIDVARLRTPGSEIKEALLPIPMIYASFSITDDLSVEALKMLGFKSFRIDPRGTFFATNDFITDDGDQVYAGFGRRNDQHENSPQGNAETASHSVGRAPNRLPEKPKNQYGLALRYLASWLNDTELGFYYLKYHSRVPLVSAFRDTGAASDCGPPTNTCATPITDLLQDQSTVQYFAEYPEDIKLYGLSFNTNLPLGLAVQGEYSYRPNLPVQMGAIELLLGALRQSNQNDRAAGVDPQTAPVYQQGWQRIKTQQLQTTITKAFGPTFGAEQFIMLGEIGVTKMDLPPGFLFNAPGTQLPDCGDGTVVLALSNGSCQEGRGYATSLSYAYRFLTRMDFEDLLFGAGVSPRVIFTQDLKGVNTASGFNQGAKVFITGVTANYLQRYTLDLSYTMFMGGRTYTGTDPGPPPVGAQDANGNTQSSDYKISANPNLDRDFMAVSVSYAF